MRVEESEKIFNHFYLPCDWMCIWVNVEMIKRKRCRGIWSIIDRRRRLRWRKGSENYIRDRVIILNFLSTEKKFSIVDFDLKNSLPIFRLTLSSRVSFKTSEKVPSCGICFKKDETKILLVVSGRIMIATIEGRVRDKEMRWWDNLRPHGNLRTQIILCFLRTNPPSKVLLCVTHNFFDFNLAQQIFNGFLFLLVKTISMPLSDST